jgi:hypothetical protein
MCATTDSQDNTFRLLDTDNRVVLSINSPIRLIVTAADVPHAWTVPRLGIKTDATPGRLNQVRFSINRPGLLYGQCSDICGANHRFIPIVIERVSTNQFINWVSKTRESSDVYVTSHEMCATTGIWEACWHVSWPELHVRSRDASRVDRSVSLRQNSMLNTPTRNITWAHVINTRTALVTSHELTRREDSVSPA